MVLRGGFLGYDWLGGLQDGGGVMTARNIALSMLLAIILLLLWMHSDVRAISKRLDAIGNDLQWCTWEHDNHDTKLIKGGKSAEKFRRDIGRPSDDGGC